MIYCTTQPEQTLPAPTTPPAAVHAAGSLLIVPLTLVQSASRSHMTAASLLHVPAAVRSPGIGSPMHVPSSDVQQRILSLLPQVDLAAQRAIVRF